MASEDFLGTIRRVGLCSVVTLERLPKSRTKCERTITDTRLAATLGGPSLRSWSGEGDLKFEVWGGRGVDDMGPHVPRSALSLIAVAPR